MCPGETTESNGARQRRNYSSRYDIFILETQFGTEVLVDKSKTEFKAQYAEHGQKSHLQFHFSKPKGLTKITALEQSQ
jgi:hypothetical protein